jgi:hypothetical protein
LPGFGSVCRAALSGFTTGNDGLKRPAEALVEARKFGNGILEANYLWIVDVVLFVWNTVRLVPTAPIELGFSATDLAAREYVIGFMKQAGLEVRVDPAGNIFAF